MLPLRNDGRAHGCFGPAGVQYIDRCERDIAGIFTQYGSRLLASCLDRSCFRRPDAELPKCFQAPRTHHLLSGLGTRAEDSVHGLPVRCQNRGVGPGDVDFLLGKPPVVVQLRVLRPSCLSGGQNAFQHRTNQVPYFGPAFNPRAAEHSRVLRLRQPRKMCVVIEKTELWAPPEHDRKPAGEANAYRDAQIFRPVLGWAEVGRRPVQRAHAASHLAVARKQALKLRVVGTKYR